MPPFADLVAKVDAAFRAHLTDPAFWRPAGVPAGDTPIGVMVLQPDQVLKMGLTPIQVGTVSIQVFKVDVAAPARHDLVQMQAGGLVYKIVADPRIDDEGTLWSCEAAAVG